MPKIFTQWLTAVFLAALGANALAGQTILKAYAPAHADGGQVILEIDWSQVKAAAPGVTSVLLRRRPAGLPTIADTLAVLPLDSARFVVNGLDPTLGYHFYAYFKKADGETDRFGSYPAVVHLGPLHSVPSKK
jgi:hypothetical protein